MIWMLSSVPTDSELDWNLLWIWSTHLLVDIEALAKDYMNVVAFCESTLRGLCLLNHYRAVQDNLPICNDSKENLNSESIPRL